MGFIGRSKELSVLEAKWASGKKEFGALYGRRRIGKTALLEKFAEGKKAIFFQAKRTAIYGNLQSFSKAVNKMLGISESLVYPSFEDAFEALDKEARKERLLIIIDEYPYILEQMDWFSSVLQQFIDHCSENVFLLISGSNVSLLEKEIEGHASPLYKRKTFKMELRKLNFEEACLFLEGFDNQTKAKYLSLMSSYPYYLRAIDRRFSFRDNLKNLLFDEYGPFFSLPDQVLSNSLKVQDVYNAILEAIAARKRTTSEIAEHIHEEESKVAKYLITLTGSGIVAKRETFMGNRNTSCYEIEDTLLRFWYSFIFPNEERIKTNGGMVCEELFEKIDLFLSHGFEEVCSLYLSWLNSQGKLETVFGEVKPYKVERSSLGRSIELDGVARQGDVLLIEEAKFRKIPFSLPMFEHLQESASVFPSKLKRVYYLFSRSGFDDRLLALKDVNVHLISLETMFS